jgi:hypothetical protein
MYLIERVRRDRLGRITRLQWFRRDVGGRQSHSVEVEVDDVIRRVLAHEHVNVLVDGVVGAGVRVERRGGIETLEDILGVEQGGRLADLPAL